MADLGSAPRVIVLNGGSSAGKSTLTRALQKVLPGTWLRFSVDTLVDACPPALLSGSGLRFADDGTVEVGAGLREIESQWMAGIARMAELGAAILLEDNFISGPSAQQRWRRALEGIPTGWVGVRCDESVAAARESLRHERTEGMARKQADLVHQGIEYDLELDSGTDSPEILAGRVCGHWFHAQT